MFVVDGDIVGPMEPTHGPVISSGGGETRITHEHRTLDIEKETEVNLGFVQVSPGPSMHFNQQSQLRTSACRKNDIVWGRQSASGGVRRKLLEKTWRPTSPVDPHERVCRANYQ